MKTSNTEIGPAACNGQLLKTRTLICFVTLSLLALAASACQKVDTNTNTNLSANANMSPANSNANLSPENASVIATREPEKYRATLVFSAETEGGQKTVGIPTLSAEVARNGADRRLSFKLPDGSQLIYLEQGGKHLVIAPGRKQYAELTPEATGFQLQKMMTPGQIVSYLEKLKGVERVGEETINGRTAEKYRYASTTNTSTSAGQVNTEAFAYVDKETGLPLRAELYSEASGNVQGVKGAKIVAEMRDISTTVDDTLFEVPAGLNKVPPEQVRSQIDAITNTVAAVIKALLSNMSTSTPPAGASPALTASPAMSPNMSASPNTTP
jgi:outer membrane lipoprotein-sorting protein